MTFAEPERPVDFFISRRGASAAVATEVAAVLLGAHYTVRVQDYDIAHGANFVAAMHDALKQCRHFIALLDKGYDDSPFTTAEWTSFFAAAQQSVGERRFVLLRVEDCRLDGLFAGIVVGDLVGIDDPQERRRRILAAAEGRPVASRSRPKIFENVPARLINFVGRDDVLGRLHDLLITDRATAPAMQVAIHSLPGAGKTALAAEYVHRYGEAYSGVCWISSHCRPVLVAALAELAARLDSRFVGAADQEQAARAGLDWLARSRPPFLLVYDHVETPASLVDLVPSAGARTLLTTRFADWAGRAIEFKLDLLDCAIAAEFLQRRAQRSDQGGAEALATALGFLPLALEHAGAYCKLTGSNFDGYRRKLDMRIARVPSGAANPASVADTFALAIEQVAGECPAAETLLAGFAYLAPERIPLEVAAELMPDEDEDELDQAIMALAAASLIEHVDGETQERLVAVHRLVQAAMRTRLAGGQTQAFERIFDVLAKAFPPDAYGNPKVWPRCASLLPHALSLFEHGVWRQSYPSKSGPLFHAAASYLHARGSFSAAEPLYRAALEITENVHGRNHTLYANALSTLGLLLQDTGREGNAEQLYREAIDIERSLLPADHPDLAVSLNNLAMVLHGTGRAAQAEPLFRDALRIKLAALGPEHASVGVALNNLGNALRDMGRATEAEDYYRDGLRIVEKALGREHPNAATSLQNLAVLLSENGRGDEAELLLREAVEIWSATLGGDHPTTAVGLRHLAILLLAAGRADEALPHAQAALRVYRQSWSEQHPWTIDAAHICADALDKLGRDAEAAALRLRYGAPPTQDNDGTGRV